MIKLAIPAFAALSIALSANAALAVEATILDSTITQAEVEAAQVAWGEALVQISADYKDGGIDKARATAEAVIDAAYGHDLGPVLFKPTLTLAPQTFRTTAEGAQRDQPDRWKLRCLGMAGASHQCLHPRRQLIKVEGFGQKAQR